VIVTFYYLSVKFLPKRDAGVLVAEIFVTKTYYRTAPEQIF